MREDNICFEVCVCVMECICEKEVEAGRFLFQNSQGYIVSSGPKTATTKLPNCTRGKLTSSRSLAETSLFWSLAGQLSMYPGFQRTALTSVASAVSLNLQVLFHPWSKHRRHTRSKGHWWCQPGLTHHLQRLGMSQVLRK